MTYDEGISWLQDTLKGRQTLGLWKAEIFKQKYSLVAGRMSPDEFVAKRNNQMRKLYRQYMSEKNGTRGNPFLAGSTDISKMGAVLGDDILLDGTETSLIYELVELNGYRGDFPDGKVVEVIENMVALKACLEKTIRERIRDEKFTIPIIPLCRETAAMENEVHISRYMYDRNSYEASLKDRPPRSEKISKIFSALKSMSRHPGEQVKLGEQQMPQIEEK